MPLAKWLDVSILTYNNDCLIETCKSKEFKSEKSQDILQSL